MSEEALYPEVAPSDYDQLVQEAAMNYFNALSLGDEAETHHWYAAFLVISTDRFERIDSFTPADLQMWYSYAIDQYRLATGSDLRDKNLTPQQLRMKIRGARGQFQKRTPDPLTKEQSSRAILECNKKLMVYRPDVGSTRKYPFGAAIKLEPSGTVPDQS